MDLIMDRIWMNMIEPLQYVHYNNKSILCHRSSLAPRVSVGNPLGGDDEVDVRCLYATKMGKQ